mmetsp:Transcript_52291/g.150625  ORF Transcript_52291/g.150625 Transcript_52291/m.150625 type:complete len:213 (-) Transcript_52291:114-752(-)
MMCAPEIAGTPFAWSSASPTGPFFRSSRSFASALGPSPDRQASTMVSTSASLKKPNWACACSSAGERLSSCTIRRAPPSAMPAFRVRLCASPPTRDSATPSALFPCNFPFCATGRFPFLLVTTTNPARNAPNADHSMRLLSPSPSTTPKMNSSSNRSTTEATLATIRNHKIELSRSLARSRMETNACEHIPVARATGPDIEIVCNLTGARAV